MTCIVGWRENGTITMGGDSAFLQEYYIESHVDQKVFRNGPYLIGGIQSPRMLQLLRYAFKPPMPPDQELHRFMVCLFIDAVRECFTKAGFAKTENKVEEGGCFLVGVKGRLFVVESDYQVNEHAINYAALGCGAEIALGALHALDGRGMSAHARVEAALDAAAYWCAGVEPPFTIKQLRC